MVVYKIAKGKVYVANRGSGKITYTEEEFKRHWARTVIDGEQNGICLFLESTPAFYED